MLDNALVKAWKTHYSETPDASQVQKMIDYIYASVTTKNGVDLLRASGNYKEIFETPDSFAGQTAESFLKPMAEMLKAEFPSLGVSSIKEANYWEGNLAGIDTQALNPWLVANSGAYRGVSQGSNHMKSANPEGKRGISKTPIIRSDLIERLGAEYGYNYNDPEYRNVTFAEQSDLEIAEKLKEYYTTLDEESLGRLYKRYIGAYSSEELNRDDLIKALSNRIMPSTKDGGVVMSESTANATDGIMQQNKIITPEDLKKLGLKIPTEIGVKELKNNPNRTESISLSNGLVINPEDILRQVQLEDNGVISLRYDKFSGIGNHIKYVTGTSGNRVTGGANNILTDEEWDYLAGEKSQFGGLKNRPSMFVERVDADRRKMAGHTAARYEALFAEMDPQDIEALFDEKNGNPLLKKFLNYDKKNNTITGKFSSFQEFNNSDLTDQEKYELYDTSEGSLFSRLAKKTFGNNTAAYEAFMKNNILSESVNKALEWEYFDPIGTVDRGQTEGSHVRITDREKDLLQQVFVHCNMSDIVLQPVQGIRYNSICNLYDCSSSRMYSMFQKTHKGDS